MFKLKHDANLDVGDTFFQGYFRATYQELREALGKPEFEVDEYKVSTEWILDRNGKVFTIYDYKETNLYDPDLPTVEEFRNSGVILWHIGGTSDPEHLIYQLHFQIGNKVECESEAIT